jgi:hypothetical protein
MNQVLGAVLFEVPLKVTAEAGVVVEDREDVWRDSLSVFREHLPLGPMKVEVPQGVWVLDLEAAHLSVVEALLRWDAPGSVGSPGALAGASLAFMKRRTVQ